MGFWIADEPGEAAWQNAWTIFYWGWWISWAPFVGTFIARISRGRTLREFILGVLFVPTGLGLLWFGVFGGNALHLELNAAGGVGTAGIMELVRAANYEAALYATIGQMTDAGWLTWTMSAMATLLLATWFVTSSDSGTLVITTFLSMGDAHPTAALPHRLGTRRGSGGRRAPARRRPPGPADRSHSRRPARERRAAVHDRRAVQVAGAGSVRRSGSEGMESDQWGSGRID